jgi:hypothetical protein
VDLELESGGILDSVDHGGLEKPSQRLKGKFDNEKDPKV